MYISRIAIFHLFDYSFRITFALLGDLFLWSHQFALLPPSVTHIATFSSSIVFLGSSLGLSPQGFDKLDCGWRFTTKQRLAESLIGFSDLRIHGLTTHALSILCNYSGQPSSSASLPELKAYCLAVMYSTVPIFLQWLQFTSWKSIKLYPRGWTTLRWGWGAIS